MRSAIAYEKSNEHNQMTALFIRPSFFISIFSGALFAFASMASTDLLMIIYAFISLCILVYAVQISNSIRFDLFSWGVIFHIIAFYWLTDTIAYFGGFPWWLSVIGFVFYVLFSSYQFVLVAACYEIFAKTFLGNLKLAFPLAWFLLEYVYPRLFPWVIAHPFIGITEFALLSSYVGVWLLSILVLWALEGVIELLRIGYCREVNSKYLVVSYLLVFGLLFGLGSFEFAKVRQKMRDAPSIKVALIQGSLEAKEKNEVMNFSANLTTYRELTFQAINEGAEFVIWPESIIIKWIKEEITEVGPQMPNAEFLSGFDVPMIIGGLMYRTPKLDVVSAQVDSEKTWREKMLEQVKYFNSAIGINADGSIAGLYHKQILMPLGEYLPFAETFPSLRELSPQTGDFDIGDIREPFQMKIGATEKVARIGSLICYEDLLSSISSRSVRLGANLLVNLTNDAWYGKTTAPFQHHLLARWRAVENRRYLIRSTNTGVTAIVDPLGKTIGQSEIFVPTILLSDIKLIDGVTPFARSEPIPALLLLILLGGMFLKYGRSNCRPNKKHVFKEQSSC